MLPHTPAVIGLPIPCRSGQDHVPGVGIFEVPEQFAEAGRSYANRRVNPVAVYFTLDQLVIHVVAGRNGAVVAQERNKAVRMSHVFKTLPGVRLWRSLPSLVDGDQTSVQAIKLRGRFSLEQLASAASWRLSRRSATRCQFSEH